MPPSSLPPGPARAPRALRSSVVQFCRIAAFLGWWLPALGFAQVTQLCRPGVNCTVTTLTVTSGSGTGVSIPQGIYIAGDGSQAQTTPTHGFRWDGSVWNFGSDPITTTGAGTFGSISSSGSFTALQFVSTQASGSDAFRVNTSGARINLNNGTDYFSDVSGTATFNGPLSVLTGNKVCLNSACTSYIYDIAGTTTINGSNAGIALGSGNLLQVNGQNVTDSSGNLIGTTTVKAGGNTANTLTMTGVAAGSVVTLSAGGSDTNVGVAIQAKGHHGMGLPTVANASLPTCTSATYSSSQAPNGYQAWDSTNVTEASCVTGGTGSGSGWLPQVTGEIWSGVVPSNMTALTHPAFGRVFGTLNLTITTATTFTPTGMNTPTANTTPAGLNLNSGVADPYAHKGLTYSTGTTINTKAGLNGPFTQFNTSTAPADVSGIVVIDSSFTNQRGWFGMTSADLSTADTNNSANFCAIRWSTTASDTKLQCCGSNGTTQTCASTNTTITAGNAYVMDAHLTAARVCQCFVGAPPYADSIGSGVTVGSADVGLEADVDNTTTTNHTIGLISGITLEHR